MKRKFTTTEKLWLTVAIALTLAALAVIAWGGEVGSTSSWGIVIVPCAYCSSTNDLEVHHVFPQHVFPEYAHDTNRMVVLCRRCHFTVGHKNNWINVFTNVMRVIEEGRK